MLKAWTLGLLGLLGFKSQFSTYLLCDEKKKTLPLCASL
jgi:hypothetical protein